MLMLVVQLAAFDGCSADPQWANDLQGDRLKNIVNALRLSQQREKSEDRSVATAARKFSLHLRRYVVCEK